MRSDDVVRSHREEMFKKCRNIFESARFVQGLGYGCIDPDFNPVEPEPTEARPGSREKVEIMRQRVEKGEHMFSQRDAHSRAFGPAQWRS